MLPALRPPTSRFFISRIWRSSFEFFFFEFAFSFFFSASLRSRFLDENCRWLFGFDSKRKLSEIVFGCSCGAPRLVCLCPREKFVCDFANPFCAPGR